MPTVILIIADTMAITVAMAASIFTAAGPITSMAMTAATSSRPMVGFRSATTNSAKENFYLTHAAPVFGRGVVAAGFARMRRLRPCIHRPRRDGLLSWLRKRKAQLRCVWPSTSGSLAKFAAIRRASSRVSSLAADRRPGSSSK